MPHQKTSTRGGATNTRSTSATQGELRDPPSIEEGTEDEGEARDDNMSHASPTLEERLYAARAECARLLQEQELANLETEIALLRRTRERPRPPNEEEGVLEEAPAPAAEPSISGDTQSSGQAPVQRKRPLSVSSAELPLRKRVVTPKAPDEYYGRTLKEHRDFTRHCENAFLLSRELLPTDADRILWAMQYLRDDPRDAWWSLWESSSTARESLSWEDFTTFLLNQLSDPINRGLEAATRHANAKQRGDQTVRAFATYLSTLEAQLPPYSEEHRVQHLFSKLRPPLQAAITNFHVIPATREDLIALGSTLERNIARTGTAPALHTRTSVPTGSERRPLSRLHASRRSIRGAASSRTPSRQVAGAPPMLHTPTCFNCQKQGHYSSACPEPQRSTSSKTHTAPARNPNNLAVTGRVRAGKGRAS